MGTIRSRPAMDRLGIEFLGGSTAPNDWLYLGLHAWRALRCSC